MNCKATLTANAGIILNLSGTVLLIDALHDQKAPEFSTLSESRVEKVFAFLDELPPSALLVTHSHRDHYSDRLAERAAERYSCPVFAPWLDGNGMYSSGGASVEAVELPHRKAGPDESGTHFGFIIRKDGKSVFIAGDAEPLCAETASVCSSLTPDLAVLPFMWITLRRHREALDVLNPANLALNHLPFAEDDAFGYNKAAVTSADAFRPGCVILNSFLQSANFEL